MVRVGIRELKQRASELVHLVHQTGSKVQITYRGKVVVLLIPAKPISEVTQKSWQRLDDLAAEIQAHWHRGVSVIDAVNEWRR